MLSLKAINTSFAPTSHGFFHTRKLSKAKNSILSLCTRSDSDSEASPPEGDTQKQELLARIAMLQAQKVRLTDYLDERSAYLTQFAEEARDEFDKIGEEALKGLDEADARITENIENQMRTFEESAELNRTEIEKNDHKLADFKGKMEKERNEGMFFKNLGQKASVEKAKAKEEAQKIKDLTKAKAGSKTRKNIYLALMGVLVIVIANSFVVSSPEWQKVAVLGAILAGFAAQFSYEQRLLSDIEKAETEHEEKEK